MTKNPIKWIKRESDEHTYTINRQIIYYYRTSIDGPLQLPNGYEIETRNLHADLSVPKVDILGKRDSFWQRLWKRS